MVSVGVRLGILGLLALPSSAAWAETDPSAAAFETMKSLVGTWRRADDPNSSLRIHFSLTAGGTVVMESWTRNDQPHSLTVYHRDQDSLIATHYCPQGNQPRLVLTAEAKADVLRFAFRDASDLQADRETHLYSMTFDASNDQRLIRHETYRLGHQDEHSDLVLVRDP